VFNFYYDVASWLRVKEVRVEEGPGGQKATSQITSIEFKTYNGVKLPVKQIFDPGQVKLTIEITDVKVNQGLKMDDLR
jgi:hypothetical protein